MFDLERFRAGDGAYFEELVREFGPMVMLITRSYARETDGVDDLFQEVWTHAYEKRRSFEGRGAFGAWLHRLATNVCIADHRARKSRDSLRERFADQSLPEEMGWRPVDALVETERGQLHMKLHRALAELPERQQCALALKVMEGKKSAEVASIMGIDEATVRSNVRHAIKRLTQIMEDPGNGMSRHLQAP